MCKIMNVRFWGRRNGLHEHSSAERMCKIMTVRFRGRRNGTYVCVKITSKPRPASPNYFVTFKWRETEKTRILKVGGFACIFGRTGKSIRKQDVAPHTRPEMCRSIHEHRLRQAANEWGVGSFYVSILLKRTFNCHSMASRIQRIRQTLRDVHGDAAGDAETRSRRIYKRASMHCKDKDQYFSLM